MPLDRCIRRLQDAASRADGFSARQVDEALDELQASHASQKERVLALETVFQIFNERRRTMGATDFGRRVSVMIDRHQDRVLIAST